jgi:branched-chain amino acid transport system substrate-binding protein
MSVSRLFLVVAAAAVLAHGHAAAAADEQFIPANITAGGRATPASVATTAGIIDYLELVNRRDGGVHGVKFAWERCDTRSDSEGGLECYQRAKAHRPNGATLVHPLTTAATYSLIERASADRIPLVSVGHGRADSANGRIFPYVFPLIGTSWTQAAAVVRYLGGRSGGMEKLRGRHIVLLYSDTPDGKDGIPVLSALAATYGYKLSMLAVTAPGTEQQEQWQKMRDLRPDWLILWGSQEMSESALQNATRANFPRGRMLAAGTAAAAAVPAGAAAQGLVAATFVMPGDEFGVLREIRSRVYGAGGGELQERSELGSLSYNRGVVLGILTVEAVRLAQEHFQAGKPITSQQAQWGLDHLNIDADRLEALGASGLMPPVETSCADHEGSGMVRFVRWEGRRWRALSEWTAPLAEDRATVLRMYAESAGAYAKGKGIEPRNCPAG